MTAFVRFMAVRLSDIENATYSDTYYALAKQPRDLIAYFERNIEPDMRVRTGVAGYGVVPFRSDEGDLGGSLMGRYVDVSMNTCLYAELHRQEQTRQHPWLTIFRGADIRPYSEMSVLYGNSVDMTSPGWPDNDDKFVLEFAKEAAMPRSVDGVPLLPRAGHAFKVSRIVPLQTARA